MVWEQIIIERFCFLVLFAVFRQTSGDLKSDWDGLQNYLADNERMITQTGPVFASVYALAHTLEHLRWVKRQAKNRGTVDRENLMALSKHAKCALAEIAQLTIDWVRYPEFLNEWSEEELKCLENYFENGQNGSTAAAVTAYRDMLFRLNMIDSQRRRFSTDMLFELFEESRKKMAFDDCKNLTSNTERKKFAVLQHPSSTADHFVEFEQILTGKSELISVERTRRSKNSDVRVYNARISASIAFPTLTGKSATKLFGKIVRRIDRGVVTSGEYECPVVLKLLHGQRNFVRSLQNEMGIFPPFRLAPISGIVRVNHLKRLQTHFENEFRKRYDNYSTWGLEKHGMPLLDDAGTEILRLVYTCKDEFDQHVVELETKALVDYVSKMNGIGAAMVANLPLAPHYSPTRKSVESKFCNSTKNRQSTEQSILYVRSQITPGFAILPMNAFTESTPKIRCKPDLQHMIVSSSTRIVEKLQMSVDSDSCDVLKSKLDDSIAAARRNIIKAVGSAIFYYENADANPLEDQFFSDKFAAAIGQLEKKPPDTRWPLKMGDEQCDRLSCVITMIHTFKSNRTRGNRALDASTFKRLMTMVIYADTITDSIAVCQTRMRSEAPLEEVISKMLDPIEKDMNIFKLIVLKEIHVVSYLHAYDVYRLKNDLARFYRKSATKENFSKSLHHHAEKVQFDTKRSAANCNQIFNSTLNEWKKKVSAVVSTWVLTPVVLNGQALVSDMIVLLFGVSDAHRQLARIVWDRLRDVTASAQTSFTYLPNEKSTFQQATKKLLDSTEKQFNSGIFHDGHMARMALDAGVRHFYSQVYEIWAKVESMETVVWRIAWTLNTTDGWLESHSPEQNVNHWFEYHIDRVKKRLRAFYVHVMHTCGVKLKYSHNKDEYMETIRLNLIKANKRIKYLDTHFSRFESKIAFNKVLPLQMTGKKVQPDLLQYLMNRARPYFAMIEHGVTCRYC